jgi:hypothetical protein
VGLWVIELGYHRDDDGGVNAVAVQSESCCHFARSRDEGDAVMLFIAAGLHLPVN